MAYSISRTEMLLTVTVTGLVSDEEFQRCVDEVRQIAMESPTLHELVDLRGVTNFAVSAGTISAAASSPPQFSPHSRQAAVVASDIGYGLCRMYGMLVEPNRPNIGVFRSLEEAIQWIEGLPAVENTIYPRISA